MASLQQSEVNGLRLGRGSGGCINSTAFGRYALNSTNNYSTGIGYRAGTNNAVNATFIGARAGQYNYGCNNTAVGFCAFQGAGNGCLNVAIGQRAFRSATDGTRNTIVGSLAFDGGTSETDNVMVGVNAGRCASTNCSVILGVDAGCNLTYSGNVIIGHRANRNCSGNNKNVIIGRCAGYSNVYKEVIIIGTDVSVTGDYHIVWGNSNNNVYNCNWGGWSYFSDARDKTDIEPLTCDTGIKFIKKLRPVSFNLDNRKNYVDKCNFVYGQKDGTLAVEKKEYGFIAQELEQVLEELNITDFSGLKYNEDKDAYRLAYAELLAPLTKAIQEIDERTQALKLKIGI